MTHEVVVVGGGIGGVTVAALLAARGVDVCLLERQPQVGGCLAAFEKFDYTFEPTLGLYSSWAKGEIHDRIFAELPVARPEILALNPIYVVRLPDRTEITVTSNTELFEAELRRMFPECAAAALRFYRESGLITDAILDALRRVPDLLTAGRAKRLYAFLPKLNSAARLPKLSKQTVNERLRETSPRFQRFVELQLQCFGETALHNSAYLAACVLLNLPRRNLFAISGGAATLANRLEESIKQSGGRVRLDTPVLRLSYDPSGRATGVDLLSGESVAATRAIVSNMTVWDTYGKLIGLERTPADLKKKLAARRSSGAYIIYAGMDEAAAARLPAEHLLSATEPAVDTGELIDTSRFAFAAAPRSDPRGPQGLRAVTIVFPADVDQWFTYQSDQSESEQRDQASLELGWQTVHAHMPELGADIEVIETVTPQTYYERTRRKLGMVGGLPNSVSVFGFESVSHLTTLPNVFMVGDTTFPGGGVAGASHSALIVANEITGH
jgi:phytoene dehydrogenase-like protein